MLRSILCGVLILTVLARAEDAAPATKSASPFKLNVQSCRVTRITPPELLKRFHQPWNERYNNEPSVSVILMLSSDDVTLLPMASSDLSIDTFIDDAYNNLMATPEERMSMGNYPFNQLNPQVSDDGHAVVFAVSSNRTIAAAAQRVFVRGKLLGRGASGPAKKVTVDLKLLAGATADAGPFKTGITTVSTAGPNQISIQGQILNDPTRVRGVRLLDDDGKSLTRDPVQINSDPRGNERPELSFSAIVPAGKDHLTVEYTYVEQVQPMAIPFEAQIDVGGTKAGPVEGPAAGSPQAAVWPPPAESSALPTARPRFTPSTGQSGEFELGKVGTDVMMLAVSKAPPASQPSVSLREPRVWTARPSPMFYPTSYTLAKLMLSTPGAQMIAIADDGIRVSKFEDDFGALDVTPFRRYPNYSMAQRMLSMISTSGDQAVVNVELRATPRSGATKMHLTGTVKTQIGRAAKTESSDTLSLAGGSEVSVGPFTLRLETVSRAPIVTPGAMPNQESPYAQITVTGDMPRIGMVEILNAKTGVVLGSMTPSQDPMVPRMGVSRQVMIPIQPANVQDVQLRVRYFERVEDVELPFDVTTTLGL